jgi:hypothetical protein
MLPFGNVRVADDPRPDRPITFDAAGEFVKEVEVPTAFAASPHTIVSLGVAPEGTARAMKLAVTVTGGGAAAGTLPVTGGTPATLAAVAMLTVALGTLMVTVGHRRCYGSK